MSFDIVFMGTPEFAKHFLEHIHVNKNFNIKGVYTQAPKKSDRGQKVKLSAVHKFAEEKNLHVFCPTKFSNLDIDILKKIKPDVILVVAYGLILPEEVLMIPSCGSVNLHASLLPKWRGAAPIHRSIMNGDDTTGISLMKMEKGLDEGPTYLQTQIPIRENDTYDDIFKTLIKAGKQALDVYFAGHQPFWPEQQNPQLATYAHKIEKKEMEIDFNDTAFKAHKKVCAFSSKPGAWFISNSQKYKIFDTEFISKNKIKNFDISKKLILKFKEDFLLVKKIQKEGNNVMTVEEFSRGNSKALENIKNSFG